MKYKTQDREHERRRAQRIKVHLPIEYHLVVKKRRLIEKIFARDISGGGIGLRLNYPLKPGARLRTLLYFPYDKQPVASVSEVVWCRKCFVRRKACFDIGIKHIKIAARDRQRFVFLFCETMINYFVLPTHIAIDAKKNQEKSTYRR